MVATLLKLKFRLLVNGLKRSTAQLVAMILGLVSAAVGAVTILAAGVGASFVPAEHHRVVAGLVILIGAVVVLAWTLIPPLFFGVDPTLDPQRFATLNVPPRALTVGLLLSGFIGLPALLTVCFAVATALVWLRTPAALVPALMGGAIGALIAVAASRLVTAAAAGALASRRGRDLAGVGSVLVIVGLSVGFSAVSNSMGTLADNGDLGSVVDSGLVWTDWAAWTPFGAPWAVGADAAGGNWGLAAAHLLVAAAYLVVVVALWGVVLRRSIVRPPSASTSKVRDDNAVLAFVTRWAPRPAWRPTAAVAARCLRYWRSDPRYLASALALPLMPVIMIVMSLVTPMPSQAAVGGAILAAFVLSLLLNNDTAFDSTAFWLHVFAAVRGRADRAGRLAAISIWGLPVLAASIVVCCAVGQAWAWWAPVTGLCLALTYGGLGAGLVASALATTPTPLPGESPMASKSGAQMLRMAVAFGCMGAALLISAPTIVLCVLALVVSPAYGWAALVVGALSAIGAAWAGIALGGKALERRELALLSQLVRADS